MIMYSIVDPAKRKTAGINEPPTPTMSTETISLTALRPRISELVDRAHRQYERFVITRHGRAEAVLLAADELEGLLETIEVLSERGLVKRLNEAEQELLGGGGHALDDLRAALAKDGDG
jgi:prevent-host-death family protein